MDIKNQLLQEHSKKNALVICTYLENHPEQLKTFMHLLLKKESLVSQRAAMVFSAYFDRNPAHFDPFLPVCLDALSEPEHHIAIKRSILRHLKSVSIPEDRSAELIDYCLKVVENPNETVAVKAFSMIILRNFCQLYPELKTEVIPLIENLLMNKPSTGVLNCGQKVLKALKKD